VLRQNATPLLEVVDHVPLAEWEFWEQHWISQFKQWGFDLTNSTSGGRGTLGRLGWKHTSNTKERIRERNSGINNYNYGKTLSEEWKKKISDSLTGEKNPFFGKKHTKETMEKICHPVLQYTLDGSFVKEWESIEAVKQAELLGGPSEFSCPHHFDGSRYHRNANRKRQRPRCRVLEATSESAEIALHHCERDGFLRDHSWIAGPSSLCACGRTWIHGLPNWWTTEEGI
jgi:hypothetical protein